MSRKTRKLIWSAPLVAVLAVAGALAIFAALTPNQAAAQGTSGMELPGMVEKLMVKAYTSGTPQQELEVTWEAPTDGGFVTGYRIDLSDDGKRWVSYITDHGDSDLSFIYGDDDGEMLMAKETKHFRVFAFNEDGTGPGTDASGATTASHVPDRPMTLAASQGTEALADLGLDTAQDETELGFDVNGDGDAKDEAANALLTFVNRTMIRLTWVAPDNPPGAPVTGYRIEYSRDGNRWGHLADTDKADMLYYHTGLRAGVQMQYRIYAMNSVGRSTVSDGTTGKTAMSVAPDAITASATSPFVIGLSPAATDVHLKWMPPSDPAGDPVTHYRVQAREAGSETGADDMWMPLHAGKHISATNVYNFGGRDLGRAKIKTPPTIATTGDNLTSLVIIDVRIAAINRVNTDVADDGTGVNWLELSDIPVGHESAPKRAGTPGVKHDQSQHQGRSGLDVTWPTATFIAGQVPDDLDANVDYILVINDSEDTDPDTDGVQVRSLDHGPADTAESALAMGGTTSKPGYDDNMLATETERTYQVYAQNSAVTVISASVRGFPSKEITGKTNRPKLPGQPEDLTVTADGHTEIKLMWTAPMTTDPDDSCPIPPTGVTAGVLDASVEDDGSECGDTAIDGYKIQMSETGTGGWQTLQAVHMDAEMPTTYLAKMLTPGKRYHFRVAAVNSRGAGQYSEVKSEATHEAGEPTPPGGLVAQAMGHNAIKLCWFEQNLVDPQTGTARLDEGLPVLGYKITVTYMGGADGKTEMTKTLTENTMSKDTEYTAMGLMPNTEYTFKVHSITLGGVGMKYDEAMGTTDPAMVPGMPTGVTATTASDTQINLSWTAPTNNGGVDITGYIIERRYTDDMMGDIPADGYNTEVMGASFAFSNHMEWWETLNCKGMLRVFGSDADPDMDSADKTTYCGHYLDTKPTMITDATKELSAATKTKVEELYNKRYEVLTGTATSFEDDMLMEMTKYTYRVSAVNAAGRSKWSAQAMATTLRTNADPEAAGTIDAVMLKVGESKIVNVSSAFSDADPEDATLTYTASTSTVATTSVSGSMVTITGASVGEVTITVTATDSMGATATQTIKVTVESADTSLQRPTDVQASSTATGELTLTWKGGDNADYFILIAVNMTNHAQGGPYPYDRSRVDDPTFDPDTGTLSGDVTGLSSGAPYLGIVVAVKGAAPNLETLHGTAGEMTVR